MLPVYKTRFGIRSLDQKTPCEIAEICLEFITSWVEERNNEPGFQSLAIVEEIDRASSQPQIRRLNSTNGSLFHSFHWRKPDEKEPSHWVTSIDLVSDGEHFDFQLQLGIERQRVSLETQRPKTGRPRLIPKLLSFPHWHCLSGDQKLSVEPVKFTAREAEWLCDEELFSPEREIPIVIITPKEHSRYYPLIPLKLAERLGGTAKVVQVRDHIAGTVLDQFLGRSLAIGPFAVRVFGPGLQPDAGLEEHWHFLGETMRAKNLTPTDFSDFLFSKLADRGLPRFRESPLIQKFRQIAAAERRRKLKTARTEGKKDRDYVEGLEREYLNLEIENEDLTQDLSRRDEQAEELQRELVAARENIASLSTELGKPVLEHAQPPVAAEEASSTVAEVVAQAVKSCPDLEFLESANASAKDVPPTFKFLERVEKALQALQEGAAKRKAEGRIVNGWKPFFSRFGVEYKSRASEKALNTWSDEYTFLYHGQKKVFDEHFTIGAKSRNTCISLHFSTNLRKDKIILAHIGRHLRNTQS